MKGKQIANTQIYMIKTACHFSSKKKGTKGNREIRKDQNKSKGKLDKGKTDTRIKKLMIKIACRFSSGKNGD